MKFYDEKVRVLCEKLYSLIPTRIGTLENVDFVPSDYKTGSTPPPVSEFEPFLPLTELECNDGHYWLHSKFKTPAAQQGKKLYFSICSGNDAVWGHMDTQCIIYLNGKIVQGTDYNHEEVPLEFDTEYDMYIYLYTGMRLKCICPDLLLKTVDIKTEKLYYDFHVPYDAAMTFSEIDENRREILKYLSAAADLIDLRNPYSVEYYGSLDAAEKYLYDNFYNVVCGNSSKTVTCIGHTHIDVAWMWRLRQTKEKAQHSFATVINLMKEYPEYKFMSSQPQLYEYVKQEAPDLYEDIKKAVKEGRWEVEGAMWLEADCNLTSGESLVRQIIFGKRFMKEEFGVDSKILWLPDVFGYSAALPQILKKTGVEKFVTSKISWSESNKMPYDTFMWEGIDGTEIFTYFLTAIDRESPENAIRPSSSHYTTYVGYIRPSQVIGTWDRYQQKEYNNETIITFGYGDGGGGPSKDMLEQQRRLKYGIPGMPKTQIDFAANFLNRVQKNFDENCKILNRTPRWVGELYLEFHRGTYTSMAKNKKNNRKCELLCQSAEALSTIDMTMLEEAYPQEKINSLWKTVLLNQFHDILPGSSIKEVYEDSDIDYARVFSAGENIFDEKLKKLAENIKTNGGILVYNPNGFECSDVVDCDGEKVFAGNIPAFGYSVITPKKPDGSVHVTENSIENKFFGIKFDSCGNIISLFDKRIGREVVKKGEKLNQLRVFEDFPKDFDAWEITEYYKHKSWNVDNIENVEIITEGARNGIKITRKYLSSKIVQTIYLYEDIDRIDFDTYIDWHETHQLLKVFFPVDVHANEATYDIQFGNVKRSTHTNTSWDKAKFEVCAQKWADVSEDNYGVSIINDCKYGYSAEESTLSLTLIKCATYPNPEADRGVHEFRYSLYPHAGSFKDAGTAYMAQQFNQPLVSVPIPQQNGIMPESYSFISCDSRNIMIDTVKKAEDGNDIIVRLYDTFDRKSKVKISFGFDVKRVYICDMLENNEKEIEVCDNCAEINVSNFEIVTLRIVR